MTAPDVGSETDAAGPLRPGLLYPLISLLGLAAFLYPFWIPQEAAPGRAHEATAPFIAAALVGLVVVVIAFEVRRGSMNGATVALLGVLSASAGLLRLLDLPGGGSGMFFLVILGGAAFGPRFGLLLGFSSMAVSAVLTGGLGPWLPFQMLTQCWMGATAGFLGQATSRLRPGVEVVILAAFGWLWGFLYGGIMDLWWWPFAVGEGDLAWSPALSLGETLTHYARFYVVTSLPWNAAGALANVVLILMTGVPVLRSMRRFAHRLAPVVLLEPTQRNANSLPA